MESSALEYTEFRSELMQNRLLRESIDKARIMSEMKRVGITWASGCVLTVLQNALSSEHTVAVRELSGERSPVISFSKNPWHIKSVEISLPLNSE